MKTKFCGIFTVSRANARQISDGVLDMLRTRFGWQCEKNTTSSDEPDLDGSEETLEDNSDDRSHIVDEDSLELDSSDDEQHELVCEESVPAATAGSREGDHQGTYSLLIGMASDVASVLSGKKAGVQAILSKEVNSHMVCIWCISHRLQLSLKGALKRDCKEFSDLNDFLIRL